MTPIQTITAETVRSYKEWLKSSPSVNFANFLQQNVFEDSEIPHTIMYKPGTLRAILQIEVKKTPKASRKAHPRAQHMARFMGTNIRIAPYPVMRVQNSIVQEYQDFRIKNEAIIAETNAINEQSIMLAGGGAGGGAATYDNHNGFADFLRLQDGVEPGHITFAPDVLEGIMAIQGETSKKKFTKELKAAQYPVLTTEANNINYTFRKLGKHVKPQTRGDKIVEKTAAIAKRTAESMQHITGVVGERAAQVWKAAPTREQTSASVVGVLEQAGKVAKIAWGVTRKAADDVWSQAPSRATLRDVATVTAEAAVQGASRTSTALTPSPEVQGALSAGLQLAYTALASTAKDTAAATGKGALAVGQEVLSLKEQHDEMMAKANGTYEQPCLPSQYDEWITLEDADIDEAAEYSAGARLPAGPR